MSSYYKSKYRINKIREVPEDQKVAINSLFYDQMMSKVEIRKRLQVGTVKIEKALMGSRGEWEEFKKIYQVKERL